MYLYKEEYLKSLDIGIPIAWYEREKINTILELDANEKYTTYVQDSPLDDCNKTGVPSPWNPNTPEKPHYKDTDHAYDEGSKPPCCPPKNPPAVQVKLDLWEKHDDEKWVTYE